MKPDQQKEDSPLNCAASHNSVVNLSSIATTATAPAVASAATPCAQLELDRGVLQTALMFSLQSALAMTESDDEFDEDQDDKKPASRMSLDS
jgi:hypothetical protein